MQYLRQSTAAIVLVGPVLDADGAAVTGAVIGDFRLAKNGTVSTMAGNTISHSHNGCYLITLTTANTDTLDRLSISMGNTAYGMTVFRYTVLTANQYDALIANGTITPAAIEAALVNEGDATALLQAIADKIAGDLTAGDLTALAIVSAIKADATLATMISRIDATTSSRLAAASYVVPPTATENKNAVLNAMLVDHTSTGSFGAAIGAVKAKTDNLPADPADASDIAAAFVTVNSKLDAIDDYVDSEVAAIKTVTDKLNGMLVLNGSLYEYTSAALANSPSGTVYVYPMSMEQEPRNTHATITVYTEETGSQYFFAYDSAGAALSLTGKTLEFRVADTKSKQRLYTAKTSDGTLTISLGNKVTFTKSTKFTRFANTDVTYSLRDMDAGGEVLLDGQIELMWAP